MRKPLEGRCGRCGDVKAIVWAKGLCEDCVSAKRYEDDCEREAESALAQEWLDALAGTK